MILYRVVSQAELDDLRACGRFRYLGFGYEVEWFAEDLRDAREWQRCFAASFAEQTFIVTADADAATLKLMVREAHHDFVGPAWRAGPRMVHRLRFGGVINYGMMTMKARTDEELISLGRRPVRVLIRWRETDDPEFDPVPHMTPDMPYAFETGTDTLRLDPGDPRSSATGWTLFLHNVRDTDVERRLTVGSITLLVPDAPHEVLERVGTRLDFIGRPDPAADVVVVPTWVDSVADADPAMLSAVGAAVPEPAAA